jgi:hypothetical protein
MPAASNGGDDLTAQTAAAVMSRACAAGTSLIKGLLLTLANATRPPSCRGGSEFGPAALVLARAAIPCYSHSTKLLVE